MIRRKCRLHLKKWVYRRSVHARLVVNAKFYGLYALIEQIDGRFARYHFENGKNLYKDSHQLQRAISFCLKN